ncbi:MAG: hypothetical protein L6R36_003694 [Xanthoria steineri]|nr:MAG: hypothetical protein L6R36_003694 [Xanthoria steineri]
MLLGQASLALIVVSLVYFVSKLFYNLRFHPLARFPGPPLWAASRIPYAWTLLRGDLTQRTKELHDCYGNVVRLAPNELSFIDAQAWQDIYAHHQGRPNFPKNPLWMAPAENGIHSILSANDADHSRYRRLLSHAFSDRALREQEPLLQHYIDFLVRRLREYASTPSSTVDMVQWFNFTTFDIVGDLALGSSFGNLEKARYDGWISVIFAQFKLAALAVTFRFFGLDGILKAMLPKSAIEKRKRHAETANAKIHRRLEQEERGKDEQRNDFMTYVRRYNDEKGMSVLEIEATFRALVVAGSETTATALSGILGNLLQAPTAMDKLVKEVRSAFSHESEIVAAKVDGLAYLNAVIEEGFRLCPPVALGMPRLVPQGGSTISGYPLPAGTFVSCSSYASSRSPLHFPFSPDIFIPSRWLPNNDPQSPPPPKQGTATSAFHPFSLGPRNCLGRNLAYLELRLILARLVWEFDFEFVGRGWRWEGQKSWILWEKGALEVRVHSSRGATEFKG